MATKIYYIKGTGSLDSCTSMGQTISGNVRFEAVFKLNSTHFVPWGICPDTGWGGSENADCRFTLTREPNWYFDYGSFRIGPVSASPYITPLTQHRIKIEGSSTNITITDLDENTVLINQNISTSGWPNGPWMLGTTSNLQFYEGKVWVGNTLTIDCKADATGLKNNLTDSYYTLNNVQYGNYDEIAGDPVPSTEPQSNNSLSIFLGPLLLRRRRCISGVEPVPVDVIKNGSGNSRLDFNTGCKTKSQFAISWKAICYDNTASANMIVSNTNSKYSELLRLFSMSGLSEVGGSFAWVTDIVRDNNSRRGAAIGLNTVYTASLVVNGTSNTFKILNPNGTTRYNQTNNTSYAFSNSNQKDIYLWGSPLMLGWQSGNYGNIGFLEFKYWDVADMSGTPAHYFKPYLDSVGQPCFKDEITSQFKYFEAGTPEVGTI